MRRAAAFLPSPPLRLPLHNGKRGWGKCTTRCSTSTPDKSDIEAYNEWIAAQQQQRHASKTSSSSKASTIITTGFSDTSEPPSFPHDTLFHSGAEEYAVCMTQVPTKDFGRIAEETEKAGLFAPCMVGAVEGQFLKMVTALCGAKRVLDIGTFTGYSALAFAQGVGIGGEVVTIEADARAAGVARLCFEGAEGGERIRLIEGDARKAVREMAAGGERFDLVFLDADKGNYGEYYEEGLKMLDKGGVLMADNALAALVYADVDPVRTSLHRFLQMVRKDDRVEQVLLTVREGILLVRKK
eukprot:GFKZ01011655.1.p1 GENE.GFKZ01011655.1~~GFKZ01011655.1.p1  ORF type:complete len:333 (+),score=52.48 GFKZ01011655.1:107-1000(+)